jgi:hypothetical protein
MSPIPSPGVVLGFAGLAVVVSILFVVGLSWAGLRLGDGRIAACRVATRALFGVLLWMGLTGAAADLVWKTTGGRTYNLGVQTLGRGMQSVTFGGGF